MPAQFRDVRRIRDEGLAVRVVAAVPAAITYARRSLLNHKVKALSIDGKSAGNPGYAFRGW